MCKVFFLMIFCPVLSPFLEASLSPGINEILLGMDQISMGQVTEGIEKLRKGRLLAFEQKNDPEVETFYQASLLEEARGELCLIQQETGVRREIHVLNAEKLLSLIEHQFPSLESHLLSLELLKEKGEIGVALKKVNTWLEGTKNPFEKGKLLFTKGKLLQGQESLFQEALSHFESIGWEGKETQYLRFEMAKKAEERGEVTKALRLLSKAVNSGENDPLIQEALSLRGKLLDKMGRPDLYRLQQGHTACGNS